jgi:hypothetical protein
MMRSFRVLRQDKQLIVFPILSAVAAIAISVPFILALFVTGGDQPHQWTVSSFALCLLWYFCANSAIIFFNCALAASAQTYFNGGTPTLGQGISQAASRAPAILAWAMIVSTVGVFLRWVDDRAGLIGKIAVALIGVAWNIATYLIVPVLVFEDLGVMESIRRSTELLRKTWGQQIVGGIAFFWFGLLFTVPGIVLGAIGVATFWPLIPVAVAYFIVMAASFSAAGQIFRVALYRYATTGQAPDGYTGEGLHGAVRTR